MRRTRGRVLGDGMAWGALVAWALLYGVMGSATPPVLAQEPGQAEREIIVKEGVGYGDIVLGASVKTVYAKYGQPAVPPPNTDRFHLDYRQLHGISFWIMQGRISQIRIYRGFPGRLESGVRCGDSMKDVFDKYGEPIRKEAVRTPQDVQYADKVLYEFRQPGMANIAYEEKATTFFFELGRVSFIYIRHSTPMPAGGVRPETIVREGVGYGDIVLGAGVEVVYTKYGQPAAPPAKTDAFSLGYRQPHGVGFRIAEGCICRIELHPEFPGRLESGVRCGDPVDSVFDKYGPPIRSQVLESTVEAGADDKVLYERPAGEAVSITYRELGVTFLFRERKVSSISIRPASRPRLQGGLAQGGMAPAEGGDPFADVRNKNLSALGDRVDEALLRTLTFNEKTRFPDKAASSAKKTLDQGRNPGLGIRALHARGITGKGVTVAIIDQNLAGTNHPEFNGKVVKYFDTGCKTPANEGSMHGPAVLSLLVGESTGTAPGARAYYAAAPSWTRDAKYYADGLRWIVEENRNLPAGEKIRVVSVSAAPSGPGSPFTKNGQAWDDAVSLATAEDILVLDCTSHKGRIGPCYFAPDEPENARKCTAGFPGRGSGPILGKTLAPTSFRTQAEEYYTGETAHQYTGRGGLSWGIPYAAGVLAMGWQVNPSLSPETIMRLLDETAHVLPDGSRVIDPPSFIAAVEKSARR